MYLHYVPKIVQWLYPRLTWHKSRKEKVIYLTFDDGPVPEITPFVLEQLNKHGAKATFFCVGGNVGRYPEILQQLIRGGHGIGNHTDHHLNGAKTDVKTYLEDVNLCQDKLRKAGVEPRLMRPPYGRIRKAQARQLQPAYEIIMWDVLTADYDRKLSPEKCLQQSIRYTQNGSVVVFHDSVKAWKNLSWVLPRYLEHFVSKGYVFKSL